MFDFAGLLLVSILLARFEPTVGKRVTSRAWIELLEAGDVEDWMALSFGKVQNMDPWSMDPLRGPGPWTGSIKIWTGSMDLLSWSGSMDPVIMDRVHGPPIFTSWGMTFHDTLRDGYSFGKPCTSLIAHLPWKFMFYSSFSLSLVILKHAGWFWKV